jgi:lipopolysaccharide export system protein LptA
MEESCKGMDMWENEYKEAVAAMVPMSASLSLQLLSVTYVHSDPVVVDGDSQSTHQINLYVLAYNCHKGFANH